MKSRRAIVRGTHLARPGRSAFTAEIELELRKDSIYYTWTAKLADGSWLATVSQPVSFRAMPADEDRFEFALSHATENIRRYRIDREHQFFVAEAYFERS